MTAFNDCRKEELGVEPLCEVLPITLSTYYAAKSRPPSARRLHIEELKPEIRRVYEENNCAYGPRKVWPQLKREGIQVADLSYIRTWGRASCTLPSWRTPIPA